MPDHVWRLSDRFDRRALPRCYLRAGWKVIGETKGGLVALGLAPDEMGDPIEPVGAQTVMAV